MQKLDRLGWADGISFTSYGLRIGIRVNRAKLPVEISNCLPIRSRRFRSNSPVDHLYSFVISDSDPAARLRRFNLVYRNAMLVGRHADYQAALELLSSDLQRLVAESSTKEIFIHAGVVGFRGRAILMPGSSQSGKSMLTAALVRAGASYYSDEYAVLDSEGRVLPYPIALSLREERRVRKLSASELGGRCGLRALPVGAVILTEFQHGKTWQPKVLSPGRGILGVLRHMVQAQTRTEEVLQRLRRAVSRCIFLSGSRGEADQTAKDLLYRFRNKGWSPDH